MSTQTLTEKIRKTINKPIGKAILTTGALLSLLCGCARSKAPTHITKMDGDSIEIYVPRTRRADWMKVLKEDGTEMRFYDQRIFENTRTIGSHDIIKNPNYVDRIEIIYPNGKRRVYKNKLGRLDKYERLFLDATNYWDRACYNIRKERIDAQSEIDSVLKLIGGNKT